MYVHVYHICLNISLPPPPLSLPIISPEVVPKPRPTSAPGSNEGAILKQIVLKGIANQLSQATVSL